MAVEVYNPEDSSNTQKNKDLEKDLGKSFSDFKKKHKVEYSKLISHFKKTRGLSKAGMDDILFKLWKLELLTGGSSKKVFASARRIFNKITMKGLGALFSLFKLVPSRLFKK